MGVTEWARLALDRFGSNLRLLLEREEDDLPVEEDPIGEFLSLKERGVRFSDDEEDLEEEGSLGEDVIPEAEEASGEGADAESAEPVVINLLDDPDEQVNVVEELPAGEDDVLTDGVEDQGGEVTAMADEGTPQGSEADTEAGAVMVADERDQVQEAEVAEEAVEATASSEVEKPQETGGGHEEKPEEDADVDNLLEVFRSEQISESPISLLSQNLEETDVYSLLEEMKWIANRVREAPTESS